MSINKLISVRKVHLVLIGNLKGFDKRIGSVNRDKRWTLMNFVRSFSFNLLGFMFRNYCFLNGSFPASSIYSRLFNSVDDR